MPWLYLFWVCRWIIPAITRQIFRRCFNVIFRLIWRRDVRHRWINVETTLCMSTLEFGRKLVKIKRQKICLLNKKNQCKIDKQRYWRRRKFYLCRYTCFLISSECFSTQPQCCLTFSWIELQMLLRWRLIQISIIILRHFLHHLLYLSQCLDLGLFMSYLCDLYFMLIVIFIIINRMNTDALVLLLIFQKISFYFWMITCMKNAYNVQIGKSSTSRCCLASAWFFPNFRLT